MRIKASVKTKSPNGAPPFSALPPALLAPPPPHPSCDGVLVYASRAASCLENDRPKHGYSPDTLHMHMNAHNNFM